ncbi:ABC transporter substrate-binding protein [Robbsia sp. KACC 23696]|uniref:ABC transporter substrate-binding protein n=1 Tax=Robbsia sp. KACC 23696 TaxID=3149231 RepID=UPI00325BA3F0
MPRFSRPKKGALAGFALSLAMTLALSLASSFAQADTLTLMTAGKSKFIYMPLVLAASLGYFRDEGLDVKILSQQAGIDSTTELLSDAVQGAAGFYDHTIDLQTRGVGLVSLVVFAQSAGLVELASARTDLHSMSGIAGKQLGVTGLGSSTYFITRYIASRAGVPSKNYTIVPIGSPDKFISAFREGRLDAALIEEPAATQLIAESGATVLADLRSVEGSRSVFGGNYAGACLYVRREWLESHHAQAQKLVTALVRSLHYIASHDAATIAAHLPQDSDRPANALYLDALRRSIPMFVVDGRMPEGAPETVLKLLTSNNTAIDPRHVDLSETYTNAFVDQASATLH